MQLRRWLISHPAMARAVCSENESQQHIQDVSYVVWYSIPFHCGSYYIASATVLYVAVNIMGEVTTYQHDLNCHYYSHLAVNYCESQFW